MPTLKVLDLDRINPALKKAGELLVSYVNKAPAELVIQQVSKSRDMEKKYHAMIGDIAKTVKDAKRNV